MKIESYEITRKRINIAVESYDYGQITINRLLKSVNKDLYKAEMDRKPIMLGYHNRLLILLKQEQHCLPHECNANAADGKRIVTTTPQQ